MEKMWNQKRDGKLKRPRERISKDGMWGRTSIMLFLSILSKKSFLS